MAIIPFSTMQLADARSAEWWAVVRGSGWQPGNVTQYLYGRGEVDGTPAIVINQQDADLDSLIIGDEMEPQEAGECSDLYPAWELGATFAVDDLVSYDDALWKCRQAHTAHDASWYPPNVPALWLRYRKDADTLLDWVIGERVLVGWQRTYDGGTYQAIQEHVTQADWTPPNVPALWSVVTPPTQDWQPGVYYTGDNTAGAGNGDVVTYNGSEYRCWQSHTSMVGWEPPNVPALWIAL